MKEQGWKIEARVRAIAGTMILVGVLLAVLFNPWWLLLPAFVGANLLQSAFSNWCMMSNILASAFPSLTQDR